MPSLLASRAAHRGDLRSMNLRRSALPMQRGAGSGVGPGLGRRARIWGIAPMTVLTSPGFGAKAGSLARVALFLVAGAAPILAIPAHILGIATLHLSAVAVVAPSGLLALLSMLTNTNECRWARTGMLAGLAAVTAYDAVRLPLVAVHVWPDFIPALGGWVDGSGGDDAALGYLWRYLGDGGGMGVVFFMLVGVLHAARPNWVAGRELIIAIGYGVFIWTGLIGTLLLPGGQDTLFHMNLGNFVLSLVGHLIYGAVLGLGLKLVVDGMARRELIASC